MSGEMANWLRLQIEQRKALAVAACFHSDGRWWRHPDAPAGDLHAGEPEVIDGELTGDVFLYREGSRPVQAQVEHIEANDPRDVIARCEAELAIIDEHWRDANGWGRPVDRCRTCTREQGYPCQTVRLVGYGYRFRPDYKDEWMPELAKAPAG